MLVKPRTSSSTNAATSPADCDSPPTRTIGVMLMLCEYAVSSTDQSRGGLGGGDAVIETGGEGDDAGTAGDAATGEGGEGDDASAGGDAADGGSTDGTGGGSTDGGDGLGRTAVRIFGEA